MIAAIYARKSTEQTGVADDAKSVNRQVGSTQYGPAAAMIWPLTVWRGGSARKSRRDGSPRAGNRTGARVEHSRGSAEPGGPCQGQQVLLPNPRQHSAS